MLVYGDSEFEATAEDLVRRLDQTIAATDPASLDDLRRLLIRSGQIEQAMEDAHLAEAGHATLLTDAAAEAFISRFCGERPRTGFASVEDRFARLSALKTGQLKVKIPEGFEFYSLYPEQYVRSAEEWSRERSPGSVDVIGIRSIGTTLSAIVHAVLKREGWITRRFTVRPSGHPFHRVVTLPVEPPSDAALVVDEGPGLSGSSMAAVAEALTNRGVPKRHIFFFPGRENGPGQYSSESVQKWWETTRRYFTPLKRIRWGGRSLSELLADRTHELLGSVVAETQDFSAGAWRRYVLADATEWPAIAPIFERRKFRIITRSGQALLWKFTGLGCLTDEPEIPAQIEERARLGWTAAPRERRHGFTALPWIEGRPLTAADADNETIQQLARYIADVSGPPPSETAINRLVDMVRENTGKALEPACRTGGASYGDGRMAPHEWLMTREGRLYKTDAHAHTQDHTLVGRQSILWDVAGAIVEWKLAPGQQSALLKAVAMNGHECPEEQVNFYREAYAAFRLGAVTLSNDVSGSAGSAINCSTFCRAS